MIDVKNALGSIVNLVEMVPIGEKSWRHKQAFHVGLSIILACLLALPGQAQQAADHRERINDHVVMIEGGGWGGTYNKMVRDLVVAFNERNELRVVPIIGEGSIQAVEDLLFLRGVDFALMQSDVLDFYQKQRIYPDIEKRLRIVGKLYNEEMHVLADSSIRSIYDLEGQRVNFGSVTSGGFMTSSIVFEQLGIDVEATTYDHEEAFHRIRRGDLAAMIRIVGAPYEFARDLSADDGIQLLPVPAGDLAGAYLETQLSADQYPNLVKPGEPVNTLAVGAVMAVYHFPETHPRRGRIENFYQRFRTGFDRLLDSERFQVKWREFEFGDADLPGWIAFRPSGSTS